jgi:hypothetical protein
LHWVPVVYLLNNAGGIDDQEIHDGYDVGIWAGDRGGMHLIPARSGRCDRTWRSQHITHGIEPSAAESLALLCRESQKSPASAGLFI